MTHFEVEQKLLAQPNNVWAILMKNGLELVSRIQADPIKRFTLVKPFQVRVVHIPMQNGTNIQVNSQPQMQPFTWFLMTKELPLSADEVWEMTDAPKQIADAYTEKTSGIVLA